jgi:hypothetical protein
MNISRKRKIDIVTQKVLNNLLSAISQGELHPVLPAT